MPSRRRVLGAAGAAGLAALAGCSRVPLVPGPQLDVELKNHTDAEVEVRLELLRPNAREYSEGLVYAERLTVPGPAERTGASGELTVEDAAPARRYLVRVRLGDSVTPPAAEYRYYPDCAPGVGRDDGLEPTLFVDIGRAEDGTRTAAAVTQTRCGDDSAWY